MRLIATRPSSITNLPANSNSSIRARWWRRRYPNHDPRELYERFWHARLACPGGGEYVCNEAWQTMESTIYGHPGQPKAGPNQIPLLSEISGLNKGLTYEHDGLRARAIIDRTAD